MMDLYLSLGTNQGDKEANLLQALSLLDESLDGRRVALSSFISTKSWGFESEDFLNCAVKYQSELKPEEILLIIKQIERKMGRLDSPEYNLQGERVYHNRIIDIDILIYGDLKISTPDLTIPHPLMHLRDFVLIPLKEILPDY